MIELDHVGPYFLFDRRRLVERWPLREGAMRSVFVVVRDVGRENVLEVAATEDQDPVEAFAACAADPAFGVRPCCRRPHSLPTRSGPNGGAAPQTESSIATNPMW